MHHDSEPYVIGNARIVTPEEEFLGAVTVDRGVIVDVARALPRRYIDCEGDYLLPGFVDVHTDNFEKHAVPRSGVVWHLVTAACSHDSAMIAAGTTTVFDSLLAGGAGNATRRQLLLPAVEALNHAAATGLLRADHFLHVRCDIVEPESIRLLGQLIDDPRLRFVTFIDDQPVRDMGRAALVHERRRGLPRGSLCGPIAPTEDEDFAGADERRRQSVMWCRSRGIAVANHDDTQAIHVTQAHRLGMKISEFPITMDAAIEAKRLGMTIICGAPNLVRGRSHTGNVAVSDLIRAGFVDILCSDYIPSSILQAVFILNSNAFGWTLPAAVALATNRPAKSFGLTDRGAIAVGQRADLVRVRMSEAVPTIHTVWRSGELVLGSSGGAGRTHSRDAVAAGHFVGAV